MEPFTFVQLLAIAESDPIGAGFVTFPEPALRLPRDAGVRGLPSALVESPDWPARVSRCERLGCRLTGRNYRGVPYCARCGRLAPAVAARAAA